MKTTDTDQETLNSPIISEWVSISVPQSAMPMEGYVARPADTEATRGPWPAVLVFMEIFGVNAHIRSVTERIAAEGYVAIAINYYHRTTPNLELNYDEAGVAEGRKHKDATTKDGLLADTRAALDYLKTRPDVASIDSEGNYRFATIGFCFGGHVGYMAATLPEIRATASFYGGGIATSTPGEKGATVDLTPQIKGEMLALFGEKDAGIPQDQVDKIEQALQASGIRHSAVRYPEADHGFFCDMRPSYNPDAAWDAWQRVKKLFASNLT